MPLRSFALFSSFLHLRPDGQVRAEEPVFTAEREGWQVMTFHCASDADVHADHWERHPAADEVVACLSGAVRLILRPETPGAAEEETALSAGSAVIVPRGRWHRLALEEPGDLMSLTLPTGSQLQPRTQEAAGHAGE